MAKWKTIEELFEEFSPRSPKYDLASLEKELNKKRNELHPDKTGGDFESNEKKKEYYRL